MAFRQKFLFYETCFICFLESDKHSGVTDGIRIRLIDLTNKIDDVTDKITGTYRDDLKRAEESKLRVEKQIVKENNAIASNSRNLNKSHSRKADLETDLAQAEERLQELNERFVKIAEEISALEDSIEAQRVEVDKAEAAYNEYVAENQRFNAEEMECAKRIDDLKKEVKRLDDALDQYRAKIGAIDNDVCSPLSSLTFSTYVHIFQKFRSCFWMIIKST